MHFIGSSTDPGGSLSTPASEYAVALIARACVQHQPPLVHSIPDFWFAVTAAHLMKGAAQCFPCFALVAGEQGRRLRSVCLMS